MLETDLAGGMREDDAVVRVARALQRPEDLGPAVDHGVMAALRAAPLAVVGGARELSPKWGTARRPQEQGWSRAWRWLVQPRAIRVSPLGALAAAGLAFVAATLGVRRDDARTRLADGHAGDVTVTGEFPLPSAAAPSSPGTASRTRDTVFVTRFMIVAPSAKQVALVGDFNDWDHGKTPLLKVSASGVWTAEVKLPPGRYEYSFLVDGQRWVADPAAPPAVGDDFGRPNSVVTVRGIDA